jgi:hypothetical protein
VNLFRGTPDFYPPGQRKLSYVIDRSSFKTQDQYDRAAKAIEQATMEWETVCGECGLDFAHVKEQDGQPAAANANFTVRMVDAGGQFIASAFFPHDPPARRVLEVDPSFFENAFDPVGVFRHELGHVLGYRHEHIRGVSGCFQEGNSWRPLTPYDPKSVMHYFCGSGGSLKLEFSQYDRTGHRRLYGLQKAAARAIPSPSPPPAGVLVVSLQGGEVVDNAAAVLRVLTDLKAVPIQSHTIAEGDRVESIYRQGLNLPGFSAAMAQFANALNGRNFVQKPLSVGEKVRYPAVQFSEGSFGIRADAVKAAEIEQNWKAVLAHPKQANASPTAGGSRRVELRAYELRIPFANPTDLESARDRIAGLKSENIVVGIETPPPAGGAKYFSSTFQDGVAPPASYTTLDKVYTNRANLLEGEQGSVLSLLGATTLPGKPACVGVACPEIVLIDKPS